MNEYIQLKKRDILKIGIKDEEGNPKLDKDGREIFITFDLEDITIPDRYNNCYKQINNAFKTLKNEIVIIEKRQDVKGKGYMTRNQEDETRALKTFYKSTEKAIDLFLGEGGTQKIFGEVRYLTMFNDLMEMLDPIMPSLKINVKNIKEKIKSKYKTEDLDVLKDE